MRRRSRRSHAVGRRSGSGRNHKMSGKIHALERHTDSHATTESEVAVAKAPGAPAHDSAGAEEATDDVEFPEAVVLVGKTHWRCVSCMILHSRTSSVDEHLNTHHRPPDSPLAVSSSPSRGRGGGRGVNHNKTVNHVPRTSEPETEEALRMSALPEEDGESQEIASKKDASDSRLLLERKHNGRGGTRKRKGRGGSERGRVFTKPLTSEDSDIEIDTAALSSPIKVLPGKRKTLSAESLANEPAEAVLQTYVKSTEEATSSPNKKARCEENGAGYDTAVSYEPTVELSISEECAPRGTLKDLIKEKYVVFVGKGGTMDYSGDSESHFDNDPPLPIETPSLQADAFLPPATPLLPDIHGPPETPILPETPHPPEVTHQPDSFHQSEASSIDCQQSTQSELLLPITSATVTAPLSSERVSTNDEGVHAQQCLISNHNFSSDGLMTNKSSVKEFASASVCMTCGAAFESPEELRLHREEMVKFYVVSCNSCGEKFHGLHQLNIHVFTTHEKFAKKFCFLCNVDCLDGFELEEHLLEHTSLETDEEDADDLESVQHTCKTCGMEMEGNLSDLMNHYHTTHDQFVCPKCYELFKDVTEYEDHNILHCSQTDSAVVYSCPVSDCFQLCEDKEALMNHISWHEDRDIHEEQQSLLQCHYCSDDFRNITSLQRHLADTHNEPDLRPFVCELCREDFSHSLELHQHNAKRHAGIKRYGCAYCDQRFAFRSAHRRHVASEHDVAATVLRM